MLSAQQETEISKFITNFLQTLSETEQLAITLYNFFTSKTFILLGIVFLSPGTYLCAPEESHICTPTVISMPFNLTVSILKGNLEWIITACVAKLGLKVKVAASQS